MPLLYSIWHVNANLDLLCIQIRICQSNIPLLAIIVTSVVAYLAVLANIMLSKN